MKNSQLKTGCSSIPFLLVVKEEQRVPGDDIAAVLEVQPVFLQHRDHIDAMALNAGVHPFREAAGLAV